MKILKAFFLWDFDEFYIAGVYSIALFFVGLFSAGLFYCFAVIVGGYYCSHGMLDGVSASRKAEEMTIWSKVCLTALVVGGFFLALLGENKLLGGHDFSLRFAIVILGGCIAFFFGFLGGLCRRLYLSLKTADPDSLGNHENMGLVA